MSALPLEVTERPAVHPVAWRIAGVVDPKRSVPHGAIVNAMTVDVEDYFQVEAFFQVIRRDDWESLPPRVEVNIETMLAIFGDAHVSATFFILGWIAERFPELVRRIAAGGHEVACHGYGHERINRQSRDQFRADIHRAKNILEDISGLPIVGYRAPTFSVGEATWWAYEILAEEGFSYSSSVYPVSHDLYGMPKAPRVPFHPLAGPFLEIPLTTTRVFNRNLPSSGGGYFRLLPYAASRWAMRQVNSKERRPCIFYCHPWEFDPGQPRIAGISMKSRLRHYTNIGRMQNRLQMLLADFSWGRMDDVFLPKSVTSSARETPAICAM